MAHNKSMQDIFNEGATAAHNSEERDTNPYPTVNGYRRAWSSGYDSVKKLSPDHKKAHDHYLAMLKESKTT